MENALVHFCRCDRRLGEWSSMLLARLSSGGRSVHCGAHVDARCRPERRRGKNDGDVARQAANRHLLAGRSRPRRGRRSPRSCRWRSPDSRATRLPKSRRSRRPSPASAAPNVRITTADAPAVSASRNERASTSTASALPGARGWRASTKRIRAVVRTAPRYGSYAAAG